MAQSTTYLYQLQNASNASLTAADFKVGVVDYEDSKLTRAQLSELESSGKTLYSYLSIGEAENFRSYWSTGGWDDHAPSFVLGENPNWEGAYRVKFWDPAWQQIVFNRLDEIVKQGYEGAYFDIVDGYTVQEVIAAYDKPGGNIRTDMENFVIALSNRAKALNPDFKIIAQNAVELLNQGTLNSPNSPLTPNTKYLNAIDGVGKESTFTDDNTSPVGWSAYDKHYLENALNAGKFVLAIEYPTNTNLQQQALNQMLNAGYVPFIGTRALDGTIPDINAQVATSLSANTLLKATGDSTVARVIVGSDAKAEVFTGNLGNDSITAYGSNDTVFGNGGHDWLSLGQGNDMGYGGGGNDTIYALEGNDTVDSGSGNDIVYGWEGNDSIEGGIGNDFITGDMGFDTINGGDGDDGIYGWTGSDVLTGGNGNDFIMSEQESDTVSGGEGNDTIYAGSEADSVDGGNGNNYILGDDGADTINAGSGDDTVFGGSDNDTINTGAGGDFIGGDAGNDLVNAGDGNDTIYGWTGSDSLDGGIGNDLLSGEGDNDLLNGGAGNDMIYGGDGNDTLIGGADNGTANENTLSITGGDLLYGMAGADVFGFQKASTGVDVIMDFQKGEDKIQLIGFSNANFNTTIKAHMYYTWEGAWIFLGNNQGIIVHGADNLTASDFSFF